MECRPALGTRVQGGEQGVHRTGVDWRSVSARGGEEGNHAKGQLDWDCSGLAAQPCPTHGLQHAGLLSFSVSRSLLREGHTNAQQD